VADSGDPGRGDQPAAGNAHGGTFARPAGWVRAYWEPLSGLVKTITALMGAVTAVAGLLSALVAAGIIHGPLTVAPSASPSASPSRPTAGAPGTWSPAHQMATPRELHTSTLLRDGRVLVAGGVSGSGASMVLNSAELYNPASGAWSPTGQMKTARGAHTATLLVDGRVLVVGGLGSDFQSLGSAELYDPSSGTWSAAGSLHDSRTNHRALLLPNGQVIVIGGNTRSAGLEQSLATLEIYNPGPQAGGWLSAPAMSTPRSGPTAILLQDKRVLVAGGSAGSGGAAAAAPLLSAELYDYRTHSWATTGSMATSHAQHTATLLNDGRVLVTGGAAVAELYSPVAGSWAPAADPLVELRQQTAVLLPSGRVLTAGGAIGNTVIGSCYLYDPASNVWQRCPDMSAPRWSHAMTTLQSGQVLVTGGVSVAVKTATPVASAELYRG
jgi:N-acetylneuraminic acid mutarotase